mmetsp:Transcript_59356/g.181015  ORF Transcript_59356/g.181015 Transcript_59356/m.181015 type:complete len:333 (+) Transcript_59356:704-1702(+)
MMSMRAFFESTSTDPSAMVSASSWGSDGLSVWPDLDTSGLGASRGATSSGPLSSASASSSLCFLPRLSLRSSSFFRFSERFCLSVRGILGNLLSSSSRITPPSPSELSASLSRSKGMSLLLLLLDEPPTLWKMSWLNHRAMRCSARRSSSSGFGTMAVLLVPSGGASAPSCGSSAADASPSSSLPRSGPFARASSAAPSIAPPKVDPGAPCSLRRACRSSSLSSSSSASLSFSRSAFSPAALSWIAALNSFISPAHAAMTRCRLVSFFFFCTRCIFVRCLSSCCIFRNCWPTAMSTSSLANRSKPSSESLSDSAASSALDSSRSLSRVAGSM